MPVFRPHAVGLAVLAIVVVSICLFRQSTASVGSTSPRQATSVPRDQLRDTLVAPTIPLAAAQKPASSSVNATTSLAERVDAWSHSGDPGQAMQAYDAVFQCLLARRRARAADIPPDKSGQDAASLCGNLRSDQVQQRLAFLEVAARAGEKGAALDFIFEGPSGNGALQDLETTDPTPPTADWLARRNTYIDGALQHCDTVLAVYLGTSIRQGGTQHLVSTLGYWTGRLNCTGQPVSNTAPLADDPQGQANLDELRINGWQQ